MIAILSVFKQRLLSINAWKGIEHGKDLFSFIESFYSTLSARKNIIYFRGETVAVVAFHNKYTFIVYINILKLIITIHNRRNYDYKIHIIELNRGLLKCMNIFLGKFISV